MVQGGPNSGMTIPLSGRPITLGRRSDNDVVVDESTVSRRHALIMETPTGYVLRDLNTTNGTFVNRDKVGIEERLLKHGDRIRMAGSGVAFIFRQEGAATQQISVDAPATGAIMLEEHPAKEPQREPTPWPQLGGKEVELLRFLDSRKGNVVSREEIARHVWPELPEGSQANKEIDETMELLRAQIEDDPLDPVHLISVGEFGFLLV